MRKNAHTILALLSLALPMTAKANVVSIDDARQTAMEYVSRSGHAATRTSIVPEVLTDAGTMYYNGQSALYVFNREGGGYVIVSADDDTPRQILGWSDRGCYDPDDTSSPLKNVLETYAAGIGHMRDASEREKSLVLQSPVPGKASGSLPSSVEPLLGEIEWGQGEPYNRMTPTYISPYSEEPVHYVTGCVATAIAQVMMYHRWPLLGRGSNSYVFEGQTLSADFSKSTYRWDLMLPDYKGGYSNEQANAVALLMHDLGIALRMGYNESGSGASLEGYELAEYFDYDRNLKCANGDCCTVEEWEGVLRSELADGRPVLISGGSQAGGHEFVCDGYDSDGFFHYNFGWDGTNNGWFASTATGFDASPSMLYGVQKNCGGTGALSLHLEDDFMWADGNILTGNMDLACVGLRGDEAVPLELGLALENKADGKVTYYPKYSSNSRSSGCWTQVVFDEVPLDGSYLVYPVGRIAGQEWQTFFHNSLRQLVVDLTVENGVKTWANNNLMDPIEDGAVQIEDCYYLLDYDNGQATMTRRNSKGNSYHGDVIIPDVIEYNGSTFRVTAVGERAFEDCADLTSVKVGANVTELGMGCFGGCNSLSSVSIAEGSLLTTVGGWAFNGCFNLKSMVLPQGTKYLSMSAFQSTGLESLTIPSSVYSVSGSCFAGSLGLKDIYLGWTSLDNVYWNADFKDDGIDAASLTVHVPEGYADVYRNSGIFGDCIIIDDGEAPAPEPQEEECIYVLGCDGIWEPSQPSALLTLRSDGCYGGDITVTDAGGGYGYFCLGTEKSEDWGVFNAYRLGAPENDYLLTGGTVCHYVNGYDASFKAQAGTHHIVVNLESCTISFDCPDKVEPVLSLDEETFIDLSGRPVQRPIGGQTVISGGHKYIYISE